MKFSTEVAFTKVVIFVDKFWEEWGDGVGVAEVDFGLEFIYDFATGLLLSLEEIGSGRGREVHWETIECTRVVLSISFFVSRSSMLVISTIKQ